MTDPLLPCDVCQIEEGNMVGAVRWRVGLRQPVRVSRRVFRGVAVSVRISIKTPGIALLICMVPCSTSFVGFHALPEGGEASLAVTSGGRDNELLEQIKVDAG